VIPHLFSARTRKMIAFDILRLRARLKSGWKRNVVAPTDRLHLGCGSRLVAGWLNVDVFGSEFDLDLASGHLAWGDAAFHAIVSQHVIEHLELRTELLPLLAELRRVLRSDGELWLSCPDLAKVCVAYVNGQVSVLFEDRKERWPLYTLGDMPIQHMVNELFHQDGEHRNLLDFDLLSWALKHAGFTSVDRVVEADLVARFPEFPRRGDDVQSLYVRAR
jgi:predicted SAM-dependent methyltransferase